MDRKAWSSWTTVPSSPNLLLLVSVPPSPTHTSLTRRRTYTLLSLQLGLDFLASFARRKELAAGTSLEHHFAVLRSLPDGLPASQQKRRPRRPSTLVEAGFLRRTKRLSGERGLRATKRFVVPRPT